MIVGIVLGAIIGAMLGLLLGLRARWQFPALARDRSRIAGELGTASISAIVGVLLGGAICLLLVMLSIRHRSLRQEQR